MAKGPAVKCGLGVHNLVRSMGWTSEYGTAISASLCRQLIACRTAPRLHEQRTDSRALYLHVEQEVPLAVHPQAAALAARAAAAPCAAAGLPLRPRCAQAAAHDQERVLQRKQQLEVQQGTLRLRRRNDANWIIKCSRDPRHQKEGGMVHYGMHKSSTITKAQGQLCQGPRSRCANTAYKGNTNFHCAYGALALCKPNHPLGLK